MELRNNDLFKGLDIEEIEDYINQNANLSEAVKVTENLMKPPLRH